MRWLLAPLLVACGPAPRDLAVDLRTDVLPFAEFVLVRTEVFAGGVAPGELAEPIGRASVDAGETEDWIAGARIAEIPDLLEPRVTVRVALLTASGNALAQSDVLVTLDADRVVTILVSRDCTGVDCPGAGDAPNETSCRAGGCVDPSCHTERADLCPPPECSTDGDCLGQVADCAEGLCVSGACLAREDRTFCSPSELCDLDRGCYAPTVPPAPSQIVSAGSSVTCEIAAGTPRCWQGRIAPVTPVAEPSITDAIQISRGEAHTCVVRSSGVLTCFGENRRGQVGAGRTSTTEGPTDVDLGGAAALEVGAGASFTCVRLANGEVRCFGANDRGQLGAGSSAAEEVVPLRVALPGGVPAHAIAAGERHACALLEGGTLACWGAGTQDALGPAAGGEDSAVPVLVPLGSVTQVSAGFDLTCAVAGGRAHCWGSNGCQQVGLGVVGPLRVADPTPVAGQPPDVVQVAAGRECHACLRTGGGEVWCWGENLCLRLGLAARTEGELVTSAERSTHGGAAFLSAGFTHNCIELQAGGIECWGSNVDGELADGTRDPYCEEPE